MIDQITLDRIQLLHPQLRDEANEIYKEICSRLTKNVMCRFAYTLRTNKEQDALYEQGRTKPGKIVTFAKGGQSYHNYGLAIDIVFLIDKDSNGSYETATWDFEKDYDGDGTKDFDEVDFVMNMYGWKGLYKANGKRWDFPHFQKTFGLTVAQLQKLPVMNGYPILKSI
jgi:peptidoglycan L-alanyl-D-glutamate endopeptidase CwlK